MSAVVSALGRALDLLTAPSVAFHFSVSVGTLLRLDGVRIKGDRPPSDWVEGFLSFHEQRTNARSFDCLVLRRVTDPHPAPNWAELFELRLMSIGAGSMWLRGFERVDGVGFVQEWRRDVLRAIKPGEAYGPPTGELRADAPRP